MSIRVEEMPGGDGSHSGAYGAALRSLAGPLRRSGRREPQGAHHVPDEGMLRPGCPPGAQTSRVRHGSPRPPRAPSRWPSSPSDGWRSPRARPLKPRTVAHYALLDRFVLPSLGGVKVRALTPEMVEDWHASLDVGTPTYRAHAYSLLRTLMGWAVEKRQATVNPCQIRGAGSVKRRRTVRPATLEELAALVEAMPAKYRPMTLLAAWAALRFGELAELRRTRPRPRATASSAIRRGVVRVRARFIVGDPEDRRRHPRRRHPAAPDARRSRRTSTSTCRLARGIALLFPASRWRVNMAAATLYRVVLPGPRPSAGRPRPALARPAPYRGRHWPPRPARRWRS